MKPYQSTQTPQPEAASAQRRGRTEPSDDLRVAVTFKTPSGAGPTKFDGRISARSVKSMAPEGLDMDRALSALNRRGFVTTVRGAMTASVRGTRAQFEKTFGTKLAPAYSANPQAAQFASVYYPPQGAPWNPDPEVETLIDDAYIQWPHIYMMAVARTRRPASRRAMDVKLSAKSAGPAPNPPKVPYFHLTVPKTVAQLLRADKVHAAGCTGKGVRVVMVDTGFAHSHPYFEANGYRSTVALAPRATNRHTDVNGHGTGESANIFAVAPEAKFIGVKVDNDAHPELGASMLEGFQEALRHKPQVISLSMGYDLRAAGNQPLKKLPNSLVALEVEIQAAVASGIVVVFSAGNGHYSFPGQMKEVISAGGVYVDHAGAMQASDYASAFQSLIYSGRSVPDFCGLVGLLPHADYIALPIPPSSEIDRENSAHDKTTPTDGWGVFSGTSAAAPQLAGVCALLLEKDPTLTASDIKAILKRTARDVSVGHANPASDPKGVGVRAGSGDDGATGAGLVDAFAAWKEV
jgi:subtilisin family serine protease